MDSNVVIDYLAGKLPEKTIEIIKQVKIKTPDAIIAASALVNGFILLSRNIRDFSSIENLELLNPYEY